jgi:mono/diheme cytochrome c family protein
MPDSILARIALVVAPALAFAVQRAPTVQPPPAKYTEVCSVCHQATGAGLAGAFPPLAGSEWVTGRADVPIAIILHGMQGEITVKGQKYNGAMMPWATSMTDAEIASVVTYIRSAWGNRASAVTAAQVRAVRTRTARRTTPWTAAEVRAMR